MAELETRQNRVQTSSVTPHVEETGDLDIREELVLTRKQISNNDDRVILTNSMVLDTKDASLTMRTVKQKDKGNLKINSIKKLNQPIQMKKNLCIK